MPHPALRRARKTAPNGRAQGSLRRGSEPPPPADRGTRLPRVSDSRGLRHDHSGAGVRSSALVPDALNRRPITRGTEGSNPSAAGYFTPAKLPFSKGDDRGFLPRFLPRTGVHQDRFTLPINSRRCSPFPPQPTYCEETGRAPSLVDRAHGLLNLCQRHDCYGTHRVPGTYRTAQGTSAWLAVVACVSVSPNVCLFSPFSRSAVFERIRARISATRVLSTPV